MIYGAVLAGGKSSRMGKDKKHLVINGASFLDKAFSVLTSAGAQCVLLSGVDESDKRELSEFRESSASSYTVPDTSEFMCSGGPPKALYSVLEWIRTCDGLDDSDEISISGSNKKVLVVIPVDMPLLVGDVLKPLIEAVVQNDREAATYRGEVFPLVLKAGTHSLQVLKQGLEREARNNKQQTGTGGANSQTDKGQRFSMKTLLATLDTVFVDPVKAGITDTSVFTNVNTPAELEACQADSKNER